MSEQIHTSEGVKPADPYKEKNFESTDLDTKVNDLVGFIRGSKFGMMTTKIAGSELLTSRCMGLAAEETGGIDLVFHTNTHSGKTDDLSESSQVNMAFLSSMSGEWASLSGTATVVTDRAEVKKYYSPLLKAWMGDLGDGVHDGGPEDPRIGVIKLKTQVATYAISKSNMITRGVEMVKGAITGEAASVHNIRELSEEEIKAWRAKN